MELTLDFQQRLNLMALVGMSQARDTMETWLVWHLMDKLMLNDEEAKSIKLIRFIQHGQEAFDWDHSVQLTPAKAIYLEEPDYERIRRKQPSMVLVQR